MWLATTCEADVNRGSGHCKVRKKWKELFVLLGMDDAKIEEGRPTGAVRSRWYIRLGSQPPGYYKSVKDQASRKLHICVGGLEGL